MPVRARRKIGINTTLLRDRSILETHWPVDISIRQRLTDIKDVIRCWAFGPM